MKTVPEYEGFDPSRHRYVLATGGGDSWETRERLTEAIHRDILNAMDSTSTDKEALELKNIDWRDWINMLEVYEGRFLVAEFSLSQWRWY